MHWIGLRPGDMHLNISSPGWAKHAYSCFFAPWNAGATVFIANQPRFNPRGMLDAIVQNDVATLCAPPTVWRMFVQEDMTAWKTSLREVCSAGEPCNPEIIEHVQKVWNLTVREGYGQTETTLQIGCFPGEVVKPGSMGRPLLWSMPSAASRAKNLAKAVCIALDPAPVGLMRGYQNDDGSFAPLGRGAYRTGDVGTRDADGYYTYVGRADDVFKASDYRISPFELESALIEHPAVAEAAVVPAPDALRMAVPKAYITLRRRERIARRATALSIFQHLRETLAPFSACDGWNSRSCRRRSPARSGGWSCGRRRRRGRSMASEVLRNFARRISGAACTLNGVGSTNRRSTFQVNRAIGLAKSRCPNEPA